MIQKLPLEIQREILAAYVEGRMTVIDVADMWGVSTDEVLAILKRNNVKVRTRGSLGGRPSVIERYSSAELAAFRKDYESGMSWRHLMTKYNLSSNRLVGRLLVELQIPQRGLGVREMVLHKSYVADSDEVRQLQEIVALYRRGVPCRRIARQFGVSDCVLRRLLLQGLEMYNISLNRQLDEASASQQEGSSGDGFFREPKVRVKRGKLKREDDGDFRLR